MKARWAVHAKRTHSPPLADWCELHAGDRVEIVKNAQTLLTGTTEEVSPSGNLLWIMGEGVEARLVMKSEGVLIRRAAC